MIELKNETVLSLCEATKHLPRRRAGKRPHVATLYRWAQHGLNGVRLETIQIGGTRCTSVEALQRFFDNLSIRAENDCARPLKSRNQQVSEASRKLSEMKLK